MNYPFVSATFFCIYAFHMALFCACSGLVARFNPRKLITQQLWLYFLGQSLMLVFRAVVLREDFAESGGVLAALLLPWRHMWYLYALIFWHLTLPLLCLLRDRLGLAGSCLGMALAVAVGLAGGLIDWPFMLVPPPAGYAGHLCRTKPCRTAAACSGSGGRLRSLFYPGLLLGDDLGQQCRAVPRCKLCGRRPAGIPHRLLSGRHCYHGGACGSLQQRAPADRSGDGAPLPSTCCTCRSLHCLCSCSFLSRCAVRPWHWPCCGTRCWPQQHWPC